MSKSIIVMDTPKGCADCGFSGCDCDRCFMLGEEISEDVYFDDGKLEDCPLCNMPERKTSNYSDAGNQYRQGWNDCIDRLTD